MQYSPVDDEISLAEIWQALRNRALLIIATTFVFAAASLVVALMMTPIFQAQAVLSPVSEGSGGSGLSNIAAQFGGLASLAGLNLGGNSSTGEAVATLNSRVLVEQYITSNNLLPELYQDQWDAATKTWKTADEDTPTVWLGTRKFIEQVMDVQTDKKTGLVKLTVEWSDPALAAKWANDLVTRANDRLRARAINNSTKNISYLYEQLDKTSIVELRESIYRLLESETKKVMLAQGSEEYAFKIIDPAVVPEKKIRPKGALIIAVGTFMGLMLSGLYALAVPKKNPQPAA